MATISCAGAGIFDSLPDIQPRVEVYKTIGDQKLNLYVYAPPDAAAKPAPRPAILFIHGGGWGAGKPDLFTPHCRYFAARGWVALTVQYRLTAQKNVSVFECIADVRSAMRWLRAHAALLGVDPKRIAVAGDSAGGHLAACLGLIDALDDPADDRAVSARPDAMILYNPVIDTTPPDGWRFLDPAVQPRAREFSPIDHVAAGAPPTLLIHGTKDTVTPIEWSERFTKLMKAAGNRIQFVQLEGKNHAFIIPGYGEEESIARAVKLTEEFLKDTLGAPLPPANDAYWSVEAVFKHVPPLRHDNRGRLPMITWPAFRTGVQDTSFQKGEALPPDVYKELVRRGLTQRLPLTPAYVAMAQAIQAAGAKVIFVEGAAGNGPYTLGPEPLHKLPKEFKAAEDDERYACPTLFAGWAKKADELRATLGKYKDAGVNVDGAWLDWEVEPGVWSKGHWEQARQCPRCQAVLPRGVLDTWENYRVFITALRASLFSAYMAGPILEIYPGIPVTNWEEIVSTAEVPAGSCWGTRNVPPRGLGFFTAANPVAYGNDIYYKYHWKAEWGYPLDVAHMDRLYTRIMLSQVSLNAENMRRLAPEKLCIPWVCRYCPDLDDDKVPILSRERYRELLRHIWLRGADSMQIFNEPRPKHPEIYLEELEDAVGVYDEMLAFRAFLDKGTIMNTAVPEVTDNGAIWSGLQLEQEALVRAFTQNGKPVKFTVTPWPGGSAVELEAPPEGMTWRLVKDAGGIKVVKERGK